MMEKEITKKIFTDLIKNSNFLINWLVDLLVSKLMDDVLMPATNYLINNGMLIYDKMEGKIKINKIQRAIDENNDDDYWDNIGTV